MVFVLGTAVVEVIGVVELHSFQSRFKFSWDRQSLFEDEKEETESRKKSRAYPATSTIVD